MTARLTAFFIISLFILLSATLAKSAESTINLQVDVATNIHSFFRNGRFVVKTNGPDSLIVKNEKTPEGQIQYTVIPEL